MWHLTRFTAPTMKTTRPLYFAIAAAFMVQSFTTALPGYGQDGLSPAYVETFDPIAVQEMAEPIATNSLGPISDPLSLAWEADEVALWAARNSPTANLLDAERSALGQNLDCKKEDQLAQIGLLQAVSRELALHSRQESAADALDVYYQAQSTMLQMEILRQAAPRLDALESLAAKAETLEIPDGDVDELADRRMGMEDRWFQADLGLQRLRNQLAHLVDQKQQVAQSAMLVTNFPNSDSIDLQPEIHISEALTHRRDLKAIETLCRCTNSKTLPAARQLLGALVPGLGLQAATATGGCSLLGGRKDDDEDLACRKAQCQKMAQARRDQITAQVRDALLQLQEANSRLEVSRRRAELRKRMAEQAKRAIEFEQGTVGSDELAELESLEQQADVISREFAVAKAIVALNRAKGTTIQQ